MPFSNTVKVLRHQASRRVRDLWTGSLTAAEAAAQTELSDSKRVEISGYFTNGYLHLGVDAAAEDHRITTNSAGALTIASPLAAAHASGTVYEIHKLWSTPDYNAFIADAIMSIGSEAVLADKDDESISVEANGLKSSGIEDEYIIPPGFRYINEIWLADSTGAFTSRLPNTEARALSSTRLRFSSWATAHMTPGRDIRLIGQGIGGTPPLADTSIVRIDPGYIADYVELQVLAPVSGGTSTRAIAARDRVRYLGASVEMKRSSAVTEHRALPGSLAVPA
ncbi:MAG: hypothetical protein ACSLE3_07150 [Microbacteriaceae bacterium]